MRRIETIIIGAGQCGLAMSHELQNRSIDHVILERGQVGNSWRQERWDSLNLLTPNWMNRVAGAQCCEADSDGFVSASGFAGFLETTAARNKAPLMIGQSVLSVDAANSGLLVQTDQEALCCNRLVIATGACARPKVPDFAGTLPREITQLTPLTYKRPSDYPDGAVLVVGASASGLQIAREAALAGRRVVLAVGNHLRLPRRYRGADILEWMHLIGSFDTSHAEVDDIERVRTLPSLPLLGHPSNCDLDLNTLQLAGVEIVGRLVAINEGKAWFSGSLAHLCKAADLKMERLLSRIEAWLVATAHEQARIEYPIAPTNVPAEPRNSLSFKSENITTVVWATGYEADHRWLNLPVFYRKGRIQHDGGVVGHGVYVMGLPYLRSGHSTHVFGAQTDAAALAEHLAFSLKASAAA